MLLYGAELADYMKERHHRQVRGLKPPPRLVIIWSGGDLASQRYIRVKERYGADIGVQVSVESVTSQTAAVLEAVERANADPTVTGIIVQLPLPSDVETDAVLAATAPTKDVDGLGGESHFEPATPKAIMWLLSSRGLALRDLKVAIVGQGRLVGAPLAELMRSAGAEVMTADAETKDLAAVTSSADVIVTATGQPNLITASLVKSATTVIDAGTSVVAGKLVGDVDPALYDRDDLVITPVPGGLGPLTVAALFDNLLIASGR